MFSVPGNKYKAISLLAGEEGYAIRQRIGITDREHLAIRKIDELLRAQAAASVAIYEGKSQEECEAMTPRPGYVSHSRGPDDCDSHTFARVCVRIWENTGTNAVNVAVDSGD